MSPEWEKFTILFCGHLRFRITVKHAVPTKADTTRNRLAPATFIFIKDINAPPIREPKNPAAAGIAKRDEIVREI